MPVVSNQFPPAILFDMDGTLTVPTFDFPAVRKAMGLPPGAGILESLATMSPQDRQAAEIILHQFEDQVAQEAPLAPGCRQLLDYLRHRGAKLALITRNRRDSVNTFLKRHPLPIDICITRQDAPHKPSPQGLLHACRALNVDAQHCWMVGDGQFDVEAGIHAGMRPIWLRLGRRRGFAAQPWHEVEDLPGLHGFAKQHHTNSHT